MDFLYIYIYIYKMFNKYIVYKKKYLDLKNIIGGMEKSSNSFANAFANSPLTKAFKEYNYTLTEQLLEYSVDDSKDLDIKLYYACLFDKYEMAILLLERGANPNTENPIDEEDLSLLASSVRKLPLKYVRFRRK